MKEERRQRSELFWRFVCVCFGPYPRENPQGLGNLTLRSWSDSTTWIPQETGPRPHHKDHPPQPEHVVRAFDSEFRWQFPGGLELKLMKNSRQILWSEFDVDECVATIDYLVPSLGALKVSLA